MSSAQTRVYRNGVLEAEDFPVADVSEHLARARHGRLGRPVRAVEGKSSTSSPTSSGSTSSPSRTRSASISVPSSTTTTRTSSCPAHSVRLDPETGRARRDRDRRLHRSTVVHHGPQGRRASRWSRCCSRWDRRPTSPSTACSFLLYGLLDVVVDGYFDAVQAFDDFYDEVSDGIFSERPLDPAQQRHWFEIRRALVRFHRLVVPMREAVSGLMRREHAAVTRGCTRTSRTCTTTSCVSASRPTRCATS